MKSFRTMFAILGVVSVLAGCSGAEAATTGVTANAISAANGQTPGEGADSGRPHAHGPHAHGPDLLIVAALHDDLGLTAAQRATIEGLVDDRRARGDHPPPDATKTAALAAAIRAGKVDVAALPTKDDAAKDAHTAALAAKLKTLHDTLSKAQRSTLVSALAERDAEGPPRREAPSGASARGDGDAPSAPRGAGHRGPLGHLLADLDLTDAQREALRTQLDATRPAPPTAAERTAMKTQLDAKLRTFEADAFDAVAFVTPPANASNRGHAEHMAKELQIVVSLLTPAQRETLAQKIERGPQPHGR